MHDGEIVAKEVMPDHVHVFVRVGPTDAPAQVVRAFKAAADVARDKVGRLRLVSLFCSAEPVGQTPTMVRRCSMPLKSSSLRV